MARNLVIVESPAKARTLKKYLGPDFCVEASVGHIKDLPEKEVGVDVEHGFRPKYVMIRGKGPVLKRIKERSQEVEKVFLAPDPDREGEAIAWHIAEEIRRTNPNICRILINEITRKGVAEALANPRALDRAKFESQQARRILDRLVGYKISPLLWGKVRRGLSAGRVQSVAVRLVVDREREIAAFVPEEYWVVQARLQADAPPPFAARLYTEDGKRARITDGAHASRVVEEAAVGPFRVVSLERKERRRSPAPPFTTAKLQQEAARLLRFPPRKTMQVAQRLYEGVDLGGEGAVGLITYMRTDSTRLSDDAVAMVRGYIARTFGDAYLPEKPVHYRNRKNAQDAHEAIRPTSMEYTPEAVRRFLEPDAYRLYRLIFNRFVACQMQPALYGQTTVDIASGRYVFRAVGSVLKFPGYLAAYGQTEEPAGWGLAPAEAGRVRGAAEESESPEDPAAGVGAGSGGELEGDEGDASGILPELREGQVLALLGLDKEQRFTEPPPRFTEASLVKELEERGIGRPSTYATIISTIQDKGYVEKREGRFHPTDLGQLVTDLLVESFPDIVDVDFTARMEEDLDRIEEGEVDWLEMLDRFYGGFSRTLARAEETMRDVKREERPTDIPCELCGRTMVVKWGKNGHFLACPGYPDCRNTKEIETDASGRVEVKEDEPAPERCPECGGPMVFKNGRFGRFIACAAYPRCKGKRPVSTGVRCPVEGCTGDLAEKRTRKGKVFYSCTRYPDCQYALWDRPVPEACPECGHRFLVELVPRSAGRRGARKRSRDGGAPKTVLACPQEGCGYVKEA